MAFFLIQILLHFVIGSDLPEPVLTVLQLLLGPVNAYLLAAISATTSHHFFLPSFPFLSFPPFFLSLLDGGKEVTRGGTHHIGATRAGIHNLQELVEHGLIALCLALDLAIVKIAHPARQPMLRRRLNRVRAEEHALHCAVHEEVDLPQSRL